jgi:hypothetical protein
VAVSARRAHSGPNGPLKTPAWGWRAPGLSFDRRTTPVVGARLPLPCGALDSPSRRSAAGCGCALGCQRSARRDVSGRAVLSATGRSGPEPSAWGRVTTSARLSFDRRSTRRDAIRCGWTLPCQWFGQLDDSDWSRRDSTRTGVWIGGCKGERDEQGDEDRVGRRRRGVDAGGPAPRLSFDRRPTAGWWVDTFLRAVWPRF